MRRTILTTTDLATAVSGRAGVVANGNWWLGSWWRSDSPAVPVDIVGGLAW